MIALYNENCLVELLWVFYISYSRQFVVETFFVLILRCILFFSNHKFRKIIEQKNIKT